MTDYDNLVTRGAANFSNDDPVIRRETLDQSIIEAVQTSSIVLANAPHVTMSSQQHRMRAEASEPVVYRIEGDTQQARDIGLKKTTSFTFEKVYLYAEEFAVIVPIPDVVVQDSDIDLWSWARTRVGTAMGKKLDDMILWGNAIPDTWNTDGLVPDAIAAGNTVTEGTTDGGEVDRPGDLGTDMCKLFENLANQGVSVNQLTTMPGFQWRVRALRGVDGHPIFDANTGRVLSLPATEDNSGIFEPDTATVVGVDWTKTRLGIRQDLQWTMHSDGVIQDDTGAIVLNLMQQDAHAMRVTFRVGFCVAQPITPLTGNSWATRPFPAGVLVPAGASS